VRAALDRFGLSHHVPLLVCDAPDVPRKPHPRVFTMRIKHEFPLIQTGNVWIVGAPCLSRPWSQTASPNLGRYPGVTDPVCGAAALHFCAQCPEKLFAGACTQGI
jgi:hypothetical protein